MTADTRRRSNDSSVRKHSQTAVTEVKTTASKKKPASQTAGSTTTRRGNSVRR